MKNKDKIEVIYSKKMKQEFDKTRREAIQKNKENHTSAVILASVGK